MVVTMICACPALFPVTTPLALDTDAIVSLVERHVTSCCVASAGKILAVSVFVWPSPMRMLS